MGPLKFHKIKLLLFIIIFIFSGCKPLKYTGTIKTDKHPWLGGRKIFIDPGHGGLGLDDPSRIGPNNVTEENTNLRVALILEDMLKKGGAQVSMSRRTDINISLNERVKMAGRFKPELLVSIHHNGSPRKDDNINYPIVFIWGNRYVRPASYDMAGYLQEEFNKIMDGKGKVLSDYSVYSETGTRVLRETRYLCPGVLGEAGFFTNEDHSRRLLDIQYNELEAEAYFNAISKYFKRGIPTAAVVFSSPVDNKNHVEIKKRKRTLMAIYVNSGNEKKGILRWSLRVTLDNISVRYKKLNDQLYLIHYGKTLYPGGHNLRFQFRNLRSQSSMILNAPFTVKIKKGDYKRLSREGRRLIGYRSRWNITEGIKMLQSALSMDKTNPGADRLLYNIARGFYRTGNRAVSEYYYNKLFYFYPESRLVKWKRRQIYRNQKFRFPVDYYGKRVSVIGEIDIEDFARPLSKDAIMDLIPIIEKKISHMNKKLKFQK